MATVRPPAVAGSFYPARPAELSALIDRLLEEARQHPAAARGAAASRTPAGGHVKALIAPHAGYIYSGPTAAIGYAALDGPCRQVVLLGPCHHVGTPHLALPGADFLGTPLGDVPVWAEGAAAARDLPGVIVSPAVHAREHSLEVHLPFIQTVLGPDVPVLPLAVGWAEPAVVASVLEAVAADPETLVVVSSDLSHYLPHAAARRVDQDTLAQVMALSSELVSEQACGVHPVNGLNEWSRRAGLRPQLLDYRNSGDTAGERSAVVGYAAVAYRQGLPDAV
ncbi:MAG: AmmeMemoRadiSam system protein B [Bifidobacteriaceae bacterium]|jgi:AmmeMemoRadiSam system protein B|nr:AmmeMemoRadiSam system protein B [Bifidobacteriaceae bacterium]